MVTRGLHPLVTLARHSVAVAAAIAVLLSGVGALRAQCEVLPSLGPQASGVRTVCESLSVKRLGERGCALRLLELTA